MPNNEDAPKFGFSPLSFTAFFDDVEELARRADLNVAATINWACRYAGSESESWKYLACFKNGQVPVSFDVFRHEVLQMYPHLDEERRYSIRDLEKFIEDTAALADMSREDLGDYYRKFVVLTEYLIARDRLSPRERDALYLAGFPQPIRSQVLQRLLIKKLDVLPCDGYQFLDVHEAAVFVLNCGSYGLANGSAPPVAPAREPRERSRFNDLLEAVSVLSTVVAGAWRPSQQPSPPSLPSLPVFQSLGTKPSFPTWYTVSTL